MLPMSRCRGGVVVRSMTCDMGYFMESCCAIYLEFAPGAKLRRVQTPFLDDSMAFAKGEPQICNTCWAKKKRGLDLAEVRTQVDASPPPQGVLAPIASRVLMKVLYAARMARPDLLKAIKSLVRKVTRWGVVCDAKLHRLMCYVQNSVDAVQVGWVGDEVSSYTPPLFGCRFRRMPVYRAEHDRRCASA